MGVFHSGGLRTMLNWFNQWREGRALTKARAEQLWNDHDGQSRFMLADQIHEAEAIGGDTKQLWAMMRHIRKLEGSDGLDSATRRTERP